MSASDTKVSPNYQSKVMDQDIFLDKRESVGQCSSFAKSLMTVS